MWRCSFSFIKVAVDTVAPLWIVAVRRFLGLPVVLSGTALAVSGDLGTPGTVMAAAAIVLATIAHDHQQVHDGDHGRREQRRADEAPPVEGQPRFEGVEVVSEPRRRSGGEHQPISGRHVITRA
jgi:hypothetical protein